MQSALTLLLVPALGLALGVQPVHAHGGTYRGPADSVPPAASPGAAAPGGSASGPRQGGAPTSPGARGPASTPSSGAPGPEPDTSVWQIWWAYNREAYVDIKAAIYDPDPGAGGAGAFLGLGPKKFFRARLAPTEKDIRTRIVPALVRILRTESNTDIVTGALIALAKIGDAEAGAGPSLAALFEPFLADKNQEIAETAAVSLGILASVPSVPVLSHLLADSRQGRRWVGGKPEVPLRTRSFAAYGLGLIGHRVQDVGWKREIVATLARQAASPALSTPDVTVACVLAMGLVPLPVEPEFGPQLPASFSSVHTSRSAQIRWLEDLARSDEQHDLVRSHATLVLARLVADLPGRADLKQSLAAFLLRHIAPHSKEPRWMRQCSAVALGTLGDADGEEIDLAIRRSLQWTASHDPDRDTQHFAVIALANVASRPGQPGFGPGSGTALVQQYLQEQLTRGESMMRPWAALGLGLLGRSLEPGNGVREACAKPLRQGLRLARTPREIGAHAIALGMLGDVDATEILLHKLSAPGEDDTRAFVALALGMIGAVEALEPIQEILKRSKYRPKLLQQTAISLGLLGDKQLVPQLIDLLRTAGSLSAQASLAQGLGAIGDARSIGPLIEMLEDPQITPLARAFAAVALGIVADKEPQAWNAKLAIGINYRANTATLTDGQGSGILEIL